MARIRTVKPELWTDPDFTECSLSARLLFIASLNFATDHGVLPDKPRQLKMQCLPADNCDVDALLDELIEHDFIQRRTAPNGDNVLVIRTFAKNQKINRPSDGRWGNPAEWPPSPPPKSGHSVKPHGEFSEAHPLEGKGRDSSEGKGQESTQDRYVGPTESFEQIEAVVMNLADRMRLRDEAAS